MSRRRVVFVARRFWPLVGEAENALAELATALARKECQVTVLTPHWRSDWPRSFMFENVHVVRLAKPAKSWWGLRGFARECAKWLDTARNDVDVIVAHCHENVEETSAAGKQFGIPVVLLAEDEEPPEPPRRKGLFHPRSSNPKAIVVNHATTSDAWVAAGYASSIVHTIAPGVPIPPEPDSDLRRTARQALGKMVAETQLPPTTPLAICFAALEENADLRRLIKVWRHVVARLPNARLWIFGAGRQRPDLNIQVELLKLQDHIAFPGLIESCDELFFCADVYVALGGPPGASHSLLQAMAAGLPVVAADTPAHRRYLTNHQHGLLFAGDDGTSLYQTIERLLMQPSLATALAGNARQQVIAEFNLSQRVAKFTRLFDELVCQAHSRS